MSVNQPSRNRILRWFFLSLAVAVALFVHAGSRDKIVVVWLLGVSAYFVSVSAALNALPERLRKTLDGGFWRTLLLDALLFLIVPVTSFALYSSSLGDPLAGKIGSERGWALLRAGDAGGAERELKQYLEKHPDDAAAHRLRVEAHYRQPYKMGRNHTRDDVSIRKEYEELPATSNVKAVALAAYYRQEGEPKTSLSWALSAPDQQGVGVAYERGQALSRLGRFEEAALAFNECLDIEEDWWRGSHGLSNSLVAMKHWGALHQLYETKPVMKEVAPSNWRKLLFHEQRWAEYLGAFFHREAPSFMSLLLGGLVCLMWFAAIRWWDYIEPEPLWLSVLAMIGGAGFSELVFVIDDMTEQTAVFGLTGEFINDLIYCIVGIGFVEELVKLLPLFLILRFTKHVNEPFDWGVYGAYAGLGFAISENLLYHDGMGTGTVVPRAISSVPFHICASALAGHFFHEGVHRGWSKPIAAFVGIGLMAVAHGVYDFLIIGPWPELSICAFFVLVGVLTLHVAVRNRALSQSPYLTPEKELFEFGGRWFLRGYILIIVAAFMARSLEVGAESALMQVLMTTVLNLMGIMVLMAMGAVHVSKRDNLSLLDPKTSEEG